MTSEPPEHFALYALGAGVLLALVVIAIGALRLVSIGLAFKKRIDAYKTLPFAPALEATQRKTAALSQRLDAAPALIARAERAIADIVAARESATQSALLARDTVAAFFKR